MWKTLSFNALVLLHAVVSSGLAQESVPSGIVDLGKWIPTSINSSGVVVGGDGSDGYVYWQNAVTNIGSLGFSDITLRQINDSNTVVGSASHDAPIAIMFKVTTAGVRKLTRIGDNGYLKGIGSYAMAINNSNTVVGGSSSNSDIWGSGFKFDGTSVLKLNGAVQANGISDNDIIVGFTRGTGFLTVNGVVTTIAGTSNANAIDKLGKYVVGNLSGGDGYIYEVSTNKLTRIPIPKGYRDVTLAAVNSSGTVVGDCRHRAHGSLPDTFVYSLSKGQAQILSKTMFASNATGSYATGINDNGDICGVYLAPRFNGFVYHP